MVLCLKIAGTMVAGWRLPFSSGRDRKAEAAAAAAAQSASADALPSRRVCVGNVAPATRSARARHHQRGVGRRIAASYDRPAPRYPLYAAARRRRPDAPAPPPLRRRARTRGSAVCSRHYRPRTVQFQRTHS